MITKNDGTTPIPNLIEVGELVIMQDGRRATIEEVKPGVEELHYLIRTHDGEQLDVEAGKIIRAKVYATWVAPGTGWDGEERRRKRAYPSESNGTHGEMPRRREEDH